MDQAKRKQKKFEPIVKARKAELEQQQVALAKARKKRLEAVSELRSNQQVYLDGVDRLNQQRKSGEMKSLLTLESSLDTIKSRLYENIKEVRFREQEERSHIDSVLDAQSRLNAIEKLRDKYRDIAVKN